MIWHSNWLDLALLQYSGVLQNSAVMIIWNTSQRIGLCLMVLMPSFLDAMGLWRIENQKEPKLSSISYTFCTAFYTLFLPHGSWFAWKGPHADPNSWHNSWANLWAHGVCRTMTLWPLFGDWVVGLLIVMNNSHVLYVLLTPIFLCRFI